MITIPTNVLCTNNIHVFESSKHLVEVMNVNIITCMQTTVLCHLINYQSIYMIKANALILAIVADKFVHFKPSI